MRLSVLLFAFLLIFGACNSGTQVREEEKKENLSSTGVFGQAFPAEDAIDAALLSTLFTETNKVETKLKGRIVECCQHSGCWLNIDIGNGEVMQVLFKDGDFTIPTSSAGKKVVINGIAYRELIEVEELRAMAREDGKPETEINLITEPAWEYSFVAEGVIIE
jgi:hypothetical protein